MATQGFFSSEGTTKNVLSLFQTRSLKHTPSRIFLPACTSVCKHIPLAADPRPSCYHGNQSPSPWRLLPPPHGSAQAKDLQVTSPSFSFLLCFSFTFCSFFLFLSLNLLHPPHLLIFCPSSICFSLALFVLSHLFKSYKILVAWLQLVTIRCANFSD